MGKQLGMIDWMQDFFAFEFDCDPAIHHEISSKAALQLDRFVDERNRFLLLYPQAHLREFIGEARLVRGFQKTRSQSSMDLDRSTDNASRQLVCSHPAGNGRLRVWQHLNWTHEEKPRRLR